MSFVRLVLSNGKQVAFFRGSENPPILNDIAAITDALDYERTAHGYEPYFVATGPEGVQHLHNEFNMPPVGDLTSILYQCGYGNKVRSLNADLTEIGIVAMDAIDRANKIWHKIYVGR